MKRLLFLIVLVILCLNTLALIGLGAIVYGLKTSIDQNILGAPVPVTTTPTPSVSTTPKPIGFGEQTTIKGTVKSYYSGSFTVVAENGVSYDLIVIEDSKIRLQSSNGIEIFPTQVNSGDPVEVTYSSDNLEISTMVVKPVKGQPIDQPIDNKDPVDPMY